MLWWSKTQEVKGKQRYIPLYENTYTNIWSNRDFMAEGTFNQGMTSVESNITHFRI